MQHDSFCLRGAGPRALLWTLLGAWVGTWLFFALVVAPTAFRVLPSTRVAGELIRPVLAALHLYGGFAGIALAVLAWRLDRTGPAVWLPLAMSALCLLSHFGVSGAIDQIRGLVVGPRGSVELAARFQLLHRLSMGIYTTVGVAGLVLVAIHARADGRPRED